MHRFAASLRSRGFEVDLREAASYGDETRRAVDALIERGNARGRAQRALDDPDEEKGKRNDNLPASVDRVLIWRCRECGVATRSGICDRCAKLKKKGAIR